MVVRALRFAVATVGSHVCLPSSVSVIVTKLVELRVQVAARINKWVPTMFERVGVFVTVKAVPPSFLGGQRRGRRVREGRSRGERSSVLNEAQTAKTSA